MKRQRIELKINLNAEVKDMLYIIERQIESRRTNKVVGFSMKLL